MHTPVRQFNAAEQRQIETIAQELRQGALHAGVQFDQHHDTETGVHTLWATTPQLLGPDGTQTLIWTASLSDENTLDRQTKLDVLGALDPFSEEELLAAHPVRHLGWLLTHSPDGMAFVHMSAVPDAEPEPTSSPHLRRHTRLVSPAAPDDHLRFLHMADVIDLDAEISRFSRGTLPSEPYLRAFTEAAFFVGGLQAADPATKQ